MSKEYLEAFYRIMETYGNTNSLEGTYNDFLTIKKALQRLEQIDNSNPSEAVKPIKAFKSLNNLESNLEKRSYRKKDAFDDIQIIKKTLIKYMLIPIFLDVIKEKCSSGDSNLWLVSCLPDYKRYMACINDTTNHDNNLVIDKHNELTDDEFHILKEVLFDE